MHRRQLPRALGRVLAAVAVAVTLGATACGDAALTGPQGTGASAARSDVSRVQGTAPTSAARRRAGYNVVAD
jgi:hypothetical protein